MRANIGSPHATSYYGETVNKASRMESAGLRNCVRVSTFTRKMLIDRGHHPDSFACCGIHEVKSYGFIAMYLLKVGSWEKCVRDTTDALRRRSSDIALEKRNTA